MSKELPKSTKVVVIGGGVAGTSCAYHLAKFGWKDVILLERDQLTSGTTWHAAGLVSQLGPSAAITKIRKYSLELYKKLEKEIKNGDWLMQNTTADFIFNVPPNQMWKQATESLGLDLGPSFGMAGQA